MKCLLTLRLQSKQEHVLNQSRDASFWKLQTSGTLDGKAEKQKQDLQDLVSEPTFFRFLRQKSSKCKKMRSCAKTSAMCGRHAEEEEEEEGSDQNFPPRKVFFKKKFSYLQDSGLSARRGKTFTGPSGSGT